VPTVTSRAHSGFGTLHTARIRTAGARIAMNEHQGCSNLKLRSLVAHGPLLYRCLRSKDEMLQSSTGIISCPNCSALPAPTGVALLGRYSSSGDAWGANSGLALAGAARRSDDLADAGHSFGTGDRALRYRISNLCRGDCRTPKRTSPLLIIGSGVAITFSNSSARGTSLPERTVPQGAPSVQWFLGCDADGAPQF
jgi:hypothetical protein